ncbi:MAG TPA: DUF4350 domain-containing protein [Acidimicrobiales bacterium]|nr:DUF4350 domain-containing protein [Acidimicrobiales bacterium]
MTWWRGLSPAARGVTALIAVIVALNLALGMLRSIVGTTPGGPTSSSYATADDGLAAYADLLQARGHPVERLRTSLDEADLAVETTLVMADPDDLSTEEADAVAAFVRGGGRLIAAGPRTNPALRRLLGTDLDWSASGAERARPLVPVSEVAAVGEVRAAGNGSWRHAAGGLPVLADGPQVLAAVATVGQGRVVALADASVLQNRFLDEADNAAFALAAAGEARRPVRFAEAAHGYADSVGLGALPSRWKWALFLGALAALAWMWSKGRRFGPPDELERELPPPRRAYVDAVGATLAKTGEPAAAARPLQRAARRRVVARAGLPPDAPDDDVVVAAARLGLADDELEALTKTPTGDDDILAAARALARLEGSTW